MSKAHLQRNRQKRLHKTSQRPNTFASGHMKSIFLGMRRLGTRYRTGFKRNVNFVPQKSHRPVGGHDLIDWAHPGLCDQQAVDKLRRGLGRDFHEDYNRRAPPEPEAENCNGRARRQTNAWMRSLAPEGQKGNSGLTRIALIAMIPT